MEWGQFGQQVIGMGWGGGCGVQLQSLLSEPYPNMNIFSRLTGDCGLLKSRSLLGTNRPGALYKTRWPWPEDSRPITCPTT